MATLTINIICFTSSSTNPYRIKWRVKVSCTTAALLLYPLKLYVTHNPRSIARKLISAAFWVVSCVRLFETILERKRQATKEESKFMYSMDVTYFVLLSSSYNDFWKKNGKIKWSLHVVLLISTEMMINQKEIYMRTSWQTWLCVLHLILCIFMDKVPRKASCLAACKKFCVQDMLNLISFLLFSLVKAWDLHIKVASGLHQGKITKALT